jgi:GNAT superfamily N-acetyltransferase
MEYITIERIGLSRQDEVVAYVLKARKELFPGLDHDRLPVDLSAFQATYIEDKQGAFLVGRNTRGDIVAAIGMLRYDGRFPFLKFRQDDAVEIVRLYVDKRYRRQGLGLKLFHALQDIARLQGVKTFYLHTHPFLSGALPFWTICGFRELVTKIHGDFETIHMLNSDLDVQVLL